MRPLFSKESSFFGTSLVINSVAIPFAAILLPLRYLLKIKIVRVRNSRIGPMAGTDLFLRRIALGKINTQGCRLIGIANTAVANHQFFTMLQREIKIIKIPQSKSMRTFFQFLSCHSLLNRWGLLQELKFSGNEYEELNTSSPSIRFTAKEEDLGRELLKTLGIGNGWFVCFHARDTAYLDSLLKKRDYQHDFRNSNIANCLPAVQYLAQKEGYALRMGAKVEKPLSALKPLLKTTLAKNKIIDYQKKIIDYATQYRSDFGDMYLLTKCKFYLGNTAGLNSIPYIFGTPVASANVIPITRGPPPGKHDLFIPKKIWFIKEKRFLTFREMIESPVILSWQSRQFREEDGLVPVENTPEEILDLTIEINERLNGTWKTTPEDEMLQQQFKELFKSDRHSYGFPSRIGTKFLKENYNLMK